MKPVTLTFLSAAILVAAVHAQRIVYVPDSSTSGGNNVIPFGHSSPTDATWSNQKYQTLIPAATLGNAGRIVEMAFVPMSTGTRQCKTIKIQLAHTMLTTLTTNFATNLGANPVTVLDTRDYYWPNSAGTWCRIGFQKPFLFVPALGNLVLDIEVTGIGMPDSTVAHAGFASVAYYRLYAFGWTGSPPANGSTDSAAGLRMEVGFDMHDVRSFGRGCKGSNSQTPSLSYSGSGQLGGGGLKILMANGLSVRPVVLLFGFTSAAPFPIELTPAGAPGCTLYVSPDATFAGVTDTSGAVSMALPIPNDAGLNGLRIYNQYVPIDPTANKLGAVTTNFGRILLGN